MNKSECWALVDELSKSGDIRKAAELCETAPCAEDVDCQRYLGWFYQRQGSLEEAISWWLKAAEQGDAESWYQISLIYGGREEYEKAMECIIRASAGGCHRVNHIIGNVYLYGYGVKSDFEKARQYYEKSAAHGFIMGERGLLVLKWKQGGFFTKLTFLLAFLAFQFKGGLIAWRNPRDPRLIDVPNVFGKKLGGGGDT